MNPGTAMAGVALIGILGANPFPAIATPALPRAGTSERHLPPRRDTPLPAARNQQCLYSAHDLRQFHWFEKTAQTTLDCAEIFNNASTTWDAWAYPWFARTNLPKYLDWAEWVTGSSRRRLVITQSLIPSTAPQDWRRRGARGEYEKYAIRLAKALIAKGLGASIIRLAAESNGTWNPDNIGNNDDDLANWRSFWSQTVRAMKSVPGSHFLFDWCVNSTYRPIPLDSYFPGDDVVDIVGVDQYDALPNKIWPRKSRWSNIADQPLALNTVMQFAKAHNKPLSIPEYGLIDIGHNGAGDNPEYITALAKLQAQTDVAYMGYFNKPINGVVLLQSAPKSLAEWRLRFALRTTTNGGQSSPLMRWATPRQIG